MNHCEHMKNLILINGAMGAGKTTVSRALQKILPDAILLDGDWCWDADPFLVTEETKHMVMENITFLFAQFLDCSAYQNVIFCWVMHEQHILSECSPACIHKIPGFCALRLCKAKTFCVKGSCRTLRAVSVTKMLLHAVSAGLSAMPKWIP